MSFLTYQCDGCGTTTNADSPIGWRTISPTVLGEEFHRLAKVPVHSHLCGVCWGTAMQVLHSNLRTGEVQASSAMSDTAEIDALDWRERDREFTTR